jgi:hypothetical protein
MPHSEPVYEHPGRDLDHGARVPPMAMYEGYMMGFSKRSFQTIG